MFFLPKIYFYLLIRRVYFLRKVNRQNDLGHSTRYLLTKEIHNDHNEIENLNVKDKYSENIKKELNLLI